MAHSWTLPNPWTGIPLVGALIKAFQDDLQVAVLLPGGTLWLENAGIPEGVLSAPPGSLCSDTTNGELYIKHTGAGNTGWKLVTHA